MTHTNNQQNKINYKSKHLIHRILNQYVKNYLGLCALAVLLMIIGSAMTAAQALLMEPIIDDIFVNQKNGMLIPIAVAVLTVFVVRGFASWGDTVIMAKVGQGIVARVQNDLFSRVIRADMAFFHNTPSGELISRLTSDVLIMRMALAETLTGFGKSLILLIFLIGVMFYQDWRMAIIAFTVFPLAAWVVSRIGKKLRNVSHSTQNEQALFSSLLSQSFQGARHVKAYGMERYEESRVRDNVNRLFKLNYKAARVAGLSTPMSETLTGIAIVTIVLYGGSQVIDGNSSAGDFFSFITAFIMAYEPMKKLAKLNNALQVGLAATTRVFDVLDTHPVIKDKPDATPLIITQPELRFNAVTFKYNDGTTALDNVSIIAPAGKKTALVGASGGGKSTVINLIPRFYDVSDGAITIDGHDIRDVTMVSLRSHIALVSQEIAIFDDTVRANIAYGTEDADDDAIIDAAKQAAAHDFITALEHGYDTRLGENGVKLSGGQRQRISIARAILRNAPILLLDEATSALDNESERLVNDALDRLQKGKTTLVVAHRLSTIADADLIYVMDGGRVVESGPHEELLSNAGQYAALYQFSDIDKKDA